jgi:hypothetical protein
MGKADRKSHSICRTLGSTEANLDKNYSLCRIQRPDSYPLQPIFLTALPSQFLTSD